MAKINSYPFDSTIQDADAWIGTDSTNRSTKQFTAEAVAAYTIGGLISGGTANTLSMFSTSGLIDSPISSTITGSGTNVIKASNIDRFTIDKPSGVTSGDPEYLISQDDVWKASFGWDDDGAGFGYLYNWAGNGWRFGAAGNNPELTIVTTAGQEGVTIENELAVQGNVGIGATNPYFDLDVAGDIRIRDQGKLYFGNSGSIPQLEIYSDSSNNMVIGDVYTNNADVLFNIQGNVGMGNTAPAAKLDIVNTSSTSSSGLLKLKSTTVFSSAQGHMIDFIRSNNTIRGFIGMNQYGVTYSTSSDYRLKRNIVPIADSIDRIKKLKPSRFNWDDGPDDYVVDGFIAHEVADVIPEAITGEKDDVDKDNAPIYQSIDQSKIVPLLTAALQQAIDKIEALESRINKLENK